VVAPDVVHLDALADEEIAEIGGRVGGELGGLPGVTFGVDVGDVVADDLDRFLVDFERG
jgi:hypothetical protein